MAVSNTLMQKPMLIIELVGPAGAGKSTLSRALSRRSATIQLGSDVELRKLKYMPVFLRNILSLLPIIIRQRRLGRWLTWDEIKSLVYLR
ncbi:MAG: AAA family ATPase, partial [Nitrososphaerales archaeon]